MLLVNDHEGLMPELLTQRKRRGPLAKMAGITPAPGRLQFGMVAGFMSERWPASNRNTRPASVGICTDARPLSAKLVKNGTLKSYKSFPHGMPTTEAETINADLLAFLKA
jgi:hypothetical protein